MASSSSYKRYSKLIDLLLIVALVVSIYAIDKVVVGCAWPALHQAGSRNAADHNQIKLAARNTTILTINTKSAEKSNAIAATSNGKSSTAAISKPAANLSATAQTIPNTARVGQVRSFSIYKFNTRSKIRTLKASLVAVGKHTDIWIDQVTPIPNKSVTALLDHFDERIYSKNISYFASETAAKRASHISILITNLGEMDGYFDPNDIASQNQTTMLYLNSKVVKNEPSEAYNTLAHEFEHLLYYVGGGADIAWLDEGMAVYAEYLNGGYPKLYVNDFKNNPNVKLANSFSYSNNNYGAAFLFIAYAADQVEKSRHSVPLFLQSTIRNSNNGLPGINATLHKYISNPNYNSYSEIYQPWLLIDFASKLKLKSA
ncbi:MAG: hypothetical protein K6T91_03185 [Firmicutes bacterium]|nr:hypothetical protein [Bacillota bacterium]